MTFLATRQGASRSHKALGHLVAKAARAAGVEKSAHGLRKYRAAALAEAGATAHQIGAWTGHESLAEIQHYVRSADRRRAVLGTEVEPIPVNPPDQVSKKAEKP
jgi:integrase